MEWPVVRVSLHFSIPARMVESGFEMVESGFEMVESGFEMVESGFEMVESGFEMVESGQLPADPRGSHPGGRVAKERGEFVPPA